MTPVLQRRRPCVIGSSRRKHWVTTSFAVRGSLTALKIQPGFIGLDRYRPALGIVISIIPGRSYMYMYRTMHCCTSRQAIGSLLHVGAHTGTDLQVAAIGEIHVY